MQNPSTWRMRELGKSLKHGKALIRGKVSGGNRWPDEPHFWIVDDCATQSTYHVLVSTRPRWSRYTEDAS